MTGGRLAGVAIGFAGVAVMIGDGRASPTSASISRRSSPCLAAALSYAFARRLRAPVPTPWAIAPLATATGQVSRRA